MGQVEHAQALAFAGHEFEIDVEEVKACALQLYKNPTFRRLNDIDDSETEQLCKLETPMAVRRPLFALVQTTGSRGLSRSVEAARHGVLFREGRPFVDFGATGSRASLSIPLGRLLMVAHGRKLPVDRKDPAFARLTMSHLDSSLGPLGKYDCNVDHLRLESTEANRIRHTCAELHREHMRQAMESSR